MGYSGTTGHIAGNGLYYAAPAERAHAKRARADWCKENGAGGTGAGRTGARRNGCRPKCAGGIGRTMGMGGTWVDV
jgi:hypothetical protein